MLTREQKAKIKEERFERTIILDRSKIDEEARTVPLAFSSEEPYERWFGVEILDHDAASVDLSRLKNGAPVLVNHKTDNHVGVVEDASIDGDKRGRAVVRFGRGAYASEIFTDVQDGIRTKISVGYSIEKYEVTEKKGEPDTVRVTGWTPHEISFASIPADDTVGVGRSKESEERTMEPEKDDDKSNNRSTPEPNTPPPVDPAKERTKLRTAEKDRIEAIRSLGGKYEGMEDMVLKAIEEGTEVGDFNRQVAEELGQRNTKLRSQETEEPDVDLTDKEMKKFSLIRLMGAIANPNDHAMQQRAGFELEVVAAAAAKLPSEFNVRGAFIPATLAYNSIGMSRAHEPIIRRDLTVGNDGDLVGTDHRGDRFIDVLRNNMVALQAGVVPLPGLVGNVDIPRQTAGASATWVSAEDGDATESEATFDTVQLQPKDLACYTEVTRRLVQQSIPAVEGIIRNDLAKAIGLGLDSAVYYGSGASGQPQGINGATGVDDPTIASATAPTYAELVTIIKTLMSSNAANNLTWIGSPDFWESMMTTPKQGSGVEGNFISNGTSIIGRPHLTSSQLTADDFVVGDFSQILMGEWGGYELNVDPYTHSLKGKIRFVVYKTVDLAIRHPEAFSFHDAA